MEDQIILFESLLKDSSDGTTSPLTMKFDSKEVRIVMISNEPWFIAKDVSDILDFSESSAMTRTLDDDEKGLSYVQTLGGIQALQIINESGLYSSILRSRLPKAKRFKKWVTGEVLPTIRKTGEYSVSTPPLLPNFNDPVAAARAWADAKEEELKAKKNLLDAQPKIEFYDKVGDSKGLHTVAEAAKLLGTGRNRLFSWMRTHKILRANNEPYQKYIEPGYFEVKENPAGDYLNAQTFVTPTGLQWLQKCREKNRVEVMEWAEKNDIN